MHFVFYGPEGSGKGTQAKQLSEKLKLPLFTTGDFVRDAAANDKSGLGNICRETLSMGKYLPDSIVNQLVENKLNTKDAKKGFVLDGFPRTLNQAKFLTETIKKAGYKLDRLIYLEISDDEAVARLSKRKRTLFGSSKILHDTPQRVRQRLSVYRVNEKQVLGYFRKSKLVLQIDASQSIEKVFVDIVSGLHLK